MWSDAMQYHGQVGIPFGLVSLVSCDFTMVMIGFEIAGCHLGVAGLTSSDLLKI